MTTRVEQDRHYFCSPGACVAPAPRKLAAGRNQGRCVPRKTWWLRTVNSVGKRISIGFKSEQEAREAARKVEAARILGQDYTPRVAAPSVPKFSEIAAEALKLHASTRSLRTATAGNHQSFLKHHLLPFWGIKAVSPATFSRLELRKWIAKLRGAEGPRALADSTLRAYLPIMSVILDYAVERGLIVTNPMRGGEPLWKASETAEAIDPFTPAELRQILAAARAINPDFATCCQIMVQSSLRPGEGLGIRRCDLDLEAGTINVRGTYSRGALGPTKNRSSLRKVSDALPRHAGYGCVAPSGCRSRNAAGAGWPPQSQGHAGGSRGPAVHLGQQKLLEALAPRLDEGWRPVPEAPRLPAQLRLDPPVAGGESTSGAEGGGLEVGADPVVELREVDRGCKHGYKHRGSRKRGESFHGGLRRYRT
jgi:hypothetical protein